MIVMDKAKARETLRQKRLAFPMSEVEKLSGLIAVNAMKIPELESAKLVAVYLPFNNEVDTREIILGLLAAGKEVCVPVVERDSNSMQFAVFDPHARLQKNKFGILEPVQKAMVDVNKIGAFFVPGIAFSEDGHRIGTGNGFYDRFFGAHKTKAAKIGLAFDFQIFQIIDCIPAEKHDVRMDFVVTEKKVIKAP